jgi:hypothetical protein
VRQVIKKLYSFFQVELHTEDEGIFSSSCLNTFEEATTKQILRVAYFQSSGQIAIRAAFATVLLAKSSLSTKT